MMHPILIALTCLLFVPVLSAKDNWLPVTPEDLAATPPADEPDAPAEILYRKIEIDLSGMPLERSESEYIRYKIYNPEKSDAYTRITRHDLNFNSAYSLDIAARLTLPDGTTRLFTKEDIKERPAYKGASENTMLGRLFGSSGYELTEKFLVIKGVTAGAILDYSIKTNRNISSEHSFIDEINSKYYPGETKNYQLQNPDLHIRKIELIGHLPANTQFICRYFTLQQSIGNSTIESDKKKGIVRIQATNVPPSLREPLAGPSPYYTLTVLQCITNTDSSFRSRQSARTSSNVNTKTDGPWSPIASGAYLKLEDYSEVTSKIKALAAEITKTGTTSAEKAELIYAYAQQMYKDFTNRPRLPPGEVEFIHNINDIIDFKNKPDLYISDPNEFLYFCHALYKAAGLESRGILLPDRALFPFHPQLVAKSALPISALMVKIDGQWKYSLPHIIPALPFGVLPWYCEGQVGLIMKDGKQELIEISNSKSAQTRIVNNATLELTENGSLIGEAKRRFIGNHAYSIRARLKNQKGNKAKTFFQRLIEADFVEFKGLSIEKPDTNEDEEGNAVERTHSKVITVLGIEGLNNPTAPIEVQYKINLPNYANISADRIILRPSVFRLKADSPFTTTSRHSAVLFPFTWQEVDVLTIKYPSTFKPEAMKMRSLSSSEVLFYRNQLSDSRAENTLKLRRESASELITVSTENYPQLKSWYDEIEKADRYEVVLSKLTDSVTTP